MLSMVFLSPAKEIPSKYIPTKASGYLACDSPEVFCKKTVTHSLE
jgi:hypothetical protein